MPVGLYYDPKPGTIDVTGFTMATSQKFRGTTGPAALASVLRPFVIIKRWSRGRANVSVSPRSLGRRRVRRMLD